MGRWVFKNVSTLQILMSMLLNKYVKAAYPIQHGDLGVTIFH